MDLLVYMDKNPFTTFFVSGFALIAICVVANQIQITLSTLFSRINVGKESSNAVKE